MSSSIIEADFEDSKTLGAPDEISNSPWVVMKFGGTSVSTAENWSRIAKLLQRRLDAGLTPLVVHSALKGVSNALEGLLTAAVADDPSNLLDDIRAQHFDLAEELGLDGHALLDTTFHELEQLVAGVRLVREVSVRVRVRIMALGELMATRLGAEYLATQSLAVEWLDARDLLTSRPGSSQQASRSYLSATCDFAPDLQLQTRLAAYGKLSLIHI